MKRLLANLTTRQKVTIGVVALIVAAGIYLLVRHHNESRFKPLFTGVSAEDGAGIVQRLKEGGVEYRLAEGGGSVLVPAEKIPELRLAMGAAGLRKADGSGCGWFGEATLDATE